MPRINSNKKNQIIGMKEKNREHKHEKTEHRANINSEKRILLRDLEGCNDTYKTLILLIEKRNRTRKKTMKIKKTNGGLGNI